MKPKIPRPVKIIAGLIVSEPGLLAPVQQALEKHWGPSDLGSDILPFSFTDYYQPEMGTDLNRKFLSFSRTVSPENLHTHKLLSNRIEEEFSLAGKRRVNIDPGYMELSKLVLFTTKNYYHRIYLAEGIYAEVTLHFRDGSFQTLPWTYPDYRSREYHEFFMRIREIYKKQLETGNTD